MMIFERDIAIDLGTTNIRVFVRGKGIMLREPSIVAVDKYTGRMLKVGQDAQKMLGRTPANIVAIHPISAGVISDYDMTALMLKELLSRVTSFSLFKPRVLVTVPSSVTGVEERNVIDAVIEAGARKVYLVESAVATAAGAGADLSKPDGHLVIDIGGGTTEIACISLGGIVCSESIDVAGDVFNEEIQKYIRQQHNIRVGERTAENIKMAIGAAVPELEEAPDDYVITGPNILTALPTTVTLSYTEIAYALEKSLLKIDAAIMKVLEMVPPELYADIVKSGIYLAGGGALIKGLDKRFSSKNGIHFDIAEDPLRAVVRGTGIALKNINQFSFLMK